MRLPRAKVTVRRMMIAVAVIALVQWVVSMRQRSAIYHQRAEAYAWLAGDKAFSGSLADLLAERECDKWAREMEKKYRRAARYPWLSVEPDTPPPNNTYDHEISLLPALSRP